MPDEVKIDSLLRLAKSKRHRLINSKDYGGIMIQLLLQLLNLDSSHFTFPKLTPYKQNIELLAVYQEYVKCNLEMFSHRNIDLIDSSLENSIYSSIEPQLVSNYIDSLVVNNQDSFLILPVSIIFFEEEENDWYAHEVGAILRKIEGDIVVSIIDKADTRIKDRMQISPDILDGKIQSNDKKGIVEYKYKIQNNPKNIEELSDVLKLGLLTDDKYINKQINILMEHKVQEIFFYELSLLAHSEEWGTKVGNYQQYLDNCFAKEIDGAIKFVLFDTSDADLLKSESKQSLQEKIQHCSPNPKRYSTKEVSKDIVAIIEKQFEILKFDPQVYKCLLTEVFQHYLQLKEVRQSSFVQKKSKQQKLAKYIVKETSRFLNFNPRISNLAISK
ncbi:hypothetical protein IGK16_001815 [Enterococcus pernyi]